MKLRSAPLGVGYICVALVAGVIVLVNLFFFPDEQAARQPVPPVEKPRDLTAILDPRPIEDGGLGAARRFTAPIHDPASLRDVRDAIGMRGLVGLAVLQAEEEAIRLPFRTPKEQVYAAAQVLDQIGLVSLYEGRYAEASAAWRKALSLGRRGDIPEHSKARMLALVGIAGLRRAEAENDRSKHDESSGSVPSASAAIYSRQSGAREALEQFTAYLNEWPEDLRVRWLLNIAYMRLGEYPEKVPPQFVVPLELSQSTLSVGRHQDVAPQAGLTSRGPNQAGGSVFDDFNGDGLPDLLTTSLDVDRGTALFVNRGDGTFVDQSTQAGLDDQVFAFNVSHADFDNDGDLDVVLVRGAGEQPMRLSLLRNNGDGRFEDVTFQAGLGEPIASGAAAWGDYDNDGWVDLYVCGEFSTAATDRGRVHPDTRNRCRLYRNRADGTFRDVALIAQVANEHLAKGAAWGDYDDDGHIDLLVANADGPARLYHNEGDGTFRDVAGKTGLAGSPTGQACWFLDYDNDGRLDLYVSDDQTTMAQAVTVALGLPVEKPNSSRLYRNLGDDGYREVGHEIGLNRPIPVLGGNFGDIDNDGYLDIYLATGWWACSSLISNQLLKSTDGARFEDVTSSSGAGQLQKGRSVSFADWNDDGDLDLFVGLGGRTPGDRAYNILFQNPGNDHHWIKVRLIGTKTNRAAIGAKIRVDVKSADGHARSIHRTAGISSSSGGNSFVQSIGLADATRVAAVTVAWPTSHTTQTFRDLAPDQTIEITEGANNFQVLKRRLSAAAKP
jgi:hypothetical protein